MKYSIASWNFAANQGGLVNLIEEFAEWGFDAISFLPSQLLELGKVEKTNLVSVIKEQSLMVTVHGNFNMTEKGVASIIDMFEERLYSITMDAAKTTNSLGTFYDFPRMSDLLAAIEHHSKGTRIFFGIEDFPLDLFALEYFQNYLQPFTANPRYGILIDIGHLNLRCSQEPYFNVSPEEYFTRIPLPVFEIHIHDNYGDDDTHGHIGRGNINFAAISNGLKKIQFDGMSTIEVCPAFHGSTSMESKPHTKKSFEYWRSLCENGS